VHYVVEIFKLKSPIRFKENSSKKTLFPSNNSLKTISLNPFTSSFACTIHDGKAPANCHAWS
jgi:hypothetical protein